MKKIFRRLLAATLILSMTMPTVAFAADKKTEAYKAYYKYLQAEIQGLGGAVRDEDYYKMFTNSIKRPAITEKLLGVWLVDVTNDGVEELIIKRYVTHDSDALLDFSDTEWICIYSYMDGKIKRIGQNQRWVYNVGTTEFGKTAWQYREPVGYIGSPSTITVCKGKDGKTYLCDGEIVYSSEGSFSFYSFNGTNMAKTAEFWINWVADWYYKSVHSYYGENYYYVNKEEVSHSVYKSKVQNYIYGGTYKLSSNNYTTVFNKLADSVKGYYTPSSWAVNGVKNATQLGYVPANLQENYTNPITRQEFCTLAVQFYETLTENTITERAYFTDTNDINVQKMGGMGIVGGVGGGKFDPNGTLTREAAASILVRLVEALGNPIAEAAPTFADNDKISSWAFSKVGQIQAAGIMGGTGGNNFSPKAAYTREQSIITVTKLSAFQPEVTGISLKEKKAELRINETITLTPVFEGSATANKQLTWTSSDSSIASVDKNGTVTAKKGGTATITATATGGAAASCKVEVEKPVGPFYVDLPQKLKVYDTYDNVCLGKVTLKELEYVEYPNYNLKFYEVQGVISETEEENDYITAEIGWRIKDYNGKVIAEDEEQINGKEGTKFDFSIHHEVYRLKENEYYTLEFYAVK